MYSLALETTIGKGSLHLFKNQSPIGGTYFDKGISSSVNLLKEIENFLNSRKISKQQIENIIISENFGSLTGRRVGQATALGLKNSLGAEIVKVDPSEAIFRLLSNYKKAAVVLPTGLANVKWLLGNKGEFEIFTTKPEAVIAEIIQILRPFKIENQPVYLFSSIDIKQIKKELGKYDLRIADQNPAYYTGQYALSKINDN